jgi:hypothetical protein
MIAQILTQDKLATNFYGKLNAEAENMGIVVEETSVYLKHFDGQLPMYPSDEEFQGHLTTLPYFPMDPLWVVHVINGVILSPL